MKILKPRTVIYTIPFYFFCCNFTAVAQQINITVVEQMPAKPNNYYMRDWKKVEAGYDNMVFNSSLRGQYLPLIFDRNSTVNFPAQKSFGIQSYVGTYSPLQGEAINVLPAVISATLAGIDKSNQSGRNYVLECREYFNKRKEENIYLNQPVASSGNDWWYETMPNVFFYQLYSLYPGTDDFPNEFVIVADQWLRAVYAMGGSTTPWKDPFMNYRAWNFSSMTPNSSGVLEPEAAGAIAWLLYNAFIVTGEMKYRAGAELAMEYLNSLDSNPSYELQLPYGTYMAARMNAELGTSYDLEKMVKWCFDYSSIRGWGVTAGPGQWGVYDVNGLVGELSPRSYAFAMNTFEQVGQLVPMVRYNSRFARAIGKWVLNAANSCRLFYTNNLPGVDQDGKSWAEVYDTNSVIAYEALLKMDSGFPKGTGDAFSSNQAATNFGLYGSSHAGILAGIIDTSSVPMILKLDLLKTDYFHKPAYPSYLLYNPYPVDKDVEIDAGSGLYDIYDAVSHRIVKSAFSKAAFITIPADQAVVAVIIPTGSIFKYNGGKTLVNSSVIDYNNGMQVLNYSPRIKSLSPVKTGLITGDSTAFYCTATDEEGGVLSYTWKADGGKFTGTGPVVKWIAPKTPGTYTVSVSVTDPQGAVDTASVKIVASLYIYPAPVIKKIKASPRKINIGTSSILTCTAIDTNDTNLSYKWSSRYGSISGSGDNVTWSAPGTEGNYYLKCEVDNSHGGSSFDSVSIMVRDFSKNQSGNLIAYYPFSGNTHDESGNNNDGIVYGAQLTPDRFGIAGMAYNFGGSTDNIRVPNSALLNMRNSITVSFWMKANGILSREEFFVSHGSWQNRWKVSLTNDKIRWTVKTDSNLNSGVKDLDSETPIEPGINYLVTVDYSGSDIEMWLNGELDSFSSWSGKILATNLDLMIGQMLPDDANYNFKGVIDEVRIYDYPLTVEEIQKLYDFKTAVNNRKYMPAGFALSQNYPNPFNPSTTITYSIPDVETTRRVASTLKVYDILGREVATLVNEEISPGNYEVKFDGTGLSSGLYFYTLRAGGFTQSKKMVFLK